MKLDAWDIIKTLLSIISGGGLAAVLVYKLGNRTAAATEQKNADDRQVGINKDIAAVEIARYSHADTVLGQVMQRLNGVETQLNTHQELLDKERGLRRTAEDEAQALKKRVGELESQLTDQKRETLLRRKDYEDRIVEQDELIGKLRDDLGEMSADLKTRDDRYEALMVEYQEVLKRVGELEAQLGARHIGASEPPVPKRQTGGKS